MRTLSLNEIYTLDFSLSDLFAMSQYWQDGAVFTMSCPRRQSAFLYFIGCDGEYKQSDGTHLFVKKGSLVYIPSGSVYECRFIGKDQTLPSTLLIEFNLSDKNGLFSLSERPFIIKSAFSSKYRKTMEEITKSFRETLVPLSSVKSLLYRLLSDLSLMYRKEIPPEFRSIEQGILYMEDSSSPDLSIEEIAKICHVSSDCFRRLFKRYSGMSPVSYRQFSQVENAKRMLSFTTLSINSIAENLGFSDTAYFCRLFKKNTGLTPTEYRNSK